MSCNLVHHGYFLPARGAATGGVRSFLPNFTEVGFFPGSDIPPGGYGFAEGVQPIFGLIFFFF